MDAASSLPSSDSLVTLVYNVQDDNYYNCDEDSYTAGYFAPDYIDSVGMNVIVLDAFDWANRVGSDPSAAEWSDGDPDNDSPELYEGVIAHELEHLLMNYSDPGELSWVDEGLADTAAFLNGYDMTGSHLTYQQVFHRETSLTRWGGGLENYGASFSYFAYLWEQAGGNGGGDLTPDLQYDDTAGDRLIKLIFEEQADSMEGVQNAIDTYNAGPEDDLRSAAELFEDWAVTMYLDDEDSALWNLENFDLGAASGGWTVAVANDEFWDDRGSYQGSQPAPKWNTAANRPAGNALPFGVSYETFRNPGPRVAIEFAGQDSTQVVPHSGPDQYWGGYESQADNVLGVGTPVTGGETVSFWNWHFIEEGWDYGFVEALVGSDWVTVPVTDVASGDGRLDERQPARQQPRGQRHHRHVRRRVLRRRAAVRAVLGRAARRRHRCPVPLLDRRRLPRHRLVHRRHHRRRRPRRRRDRRLDRDRRPPGQQLDRPAHLGVRPDTRDDPVRRGPGRAHRRGGQLRLPVHR